MEFFETIKYPKYDAKLFKDHQEYCNRIEDMLIGFQDSAYWRGVEVGVANKQEMVDALKKLAEEWRVLGKQLDESNDDNNYGECAERIMDVLE